MNSRGIITNWTIRACPFKLIEVFFHPGPFPERVVSPKIRMFPFGNGSGPDIFNAYKSRSEKH